MERNNNTYGELINNKFCELLSASRAKTWPAMKEMLDKKMPEKKKRKWLLWFTTKTGIVAIVLFSLFASAAGTYIDLRQQSGKNDNVPAKKIKKEVIAKKEDLKNEPSINKNDNQEKINIQSEKKTNASLSSSVEIKEKRVMQTAETHKGKTNSKPVTDKQLILPLHTKDTVTKNLIIPASTKDSINGSAATPPVEIVERKRAF